MSGTLCWMHNPGEQPEAAYLMRLPIGNTIPLCVDCCAWWRHDAAHGASKDDELAQPVWIRQIAPIG